MAPKTRQASNGELSKPPRLRRPAAPKPLFTEESEGSRISFRAKRTLTANGPALRRSKRVLTSTTLSKVGVNRATAKPTVEQGCEADATDAAVPLTSEAPETEAIESEVQSFEERIRVHQQCWTELGKELSERDKRNRRKMELQHRHPHTYNLVQQAYEDLPSEDYFETLKCPTAKPINEDSRKQAVSWLMYLFRELPYDISPQSLHLGVNLFDRFANSIIRDKSSRWAPRALSDEKNIQAVASTCFYISSKLQDTMAIDIADLARMAASGEGPITSRLTCDDILSWELTILQALQFKVNSPTTLDFLVTYTNSEPKLKDSETFAGKAISSGVPPVSYKDCALYIAELALLHADSVVIPSHILAAATLCCAITYVDNKHRKVSNLPCQVLEWLKDESQDLKNAATKMAKLFETKACKASLCEEADRNHSNARAYLIDVYSNRCKRTQQRAT